MKNYNKKQKLNKDGNIPLKFKLGIALSGGGTRGLAHVGVLRAFEEQHIKFDFVAGTSAGSLIGSMYCADIPLNAIVEEAKIVRRKDILNSRLVIGSESANIAKIADKMLQGKTFADLSLPFAAVAVDISQGREVVLESGDVSQAVSASCAVPALFKPVEIEDMLLVDGGLLNNMPADVCRHMGAEIVIGVDLNHNRGKGTQSRRLIDTLVATWNITTKSTMYKGYHNSDILIEPELSQYRNTSLSNIDEMVEEGYRAAMEKMDEIKELLQIR